MEKVTRDKIKAGLEVFRQLHDSQLLTHLNSCVHCGLCADSCLYYLTMKDERMIPASKVDVVASVYRRYHTLAGRVAPRLVNARELDDDTVEEMVDLLFGACTMCGRCVKHCSIGVDIEYVVRKGREMLSNMGYVPASLQATVNAALETGNNMAIPDEEFLDTIEWMEEELQDELEDPEAEIPINKTGKNILYTLNPREPKFFPLSISAMAKVFYAAGESWTLSTGMYDVTNYAYFSGNTEHGAIIGSRIYEEMEKMQAGKLVLAECGHGTRANRWEAPNYLKKAFPETLSLVELIASYLREGRITPDKSLTKEPVTLHDPCNLVRGGGIVDEQRYILKNCVEHFVEMSPHGLDNFCCGGGGGQLAMGEYNDRRLTIAEIKAEQIRKSGAKIVATPCHNCVDQLSQINVTFKLNVQIKTIAEIVADSLVIEPKSPQPQNPQSLNQQLQNQQSQK